MQLPIFYIPDITSNTITLDENTSKHVVQVLRMEKGEELRLTDGKGKMARTVIEESHRKKCEVKILSVAEEPKLRPEITIAISLVKNTSRFEWFLEKATEIGVTRIIPLLCERTERQKFRHDRLHGILVSAMVQSRQAWIPVMEEPVEFNIAIRERADQRFIAHCEKEQRSELRNIAKSGSSIILIGPEGDFTTTEITSALDKGFHPVSLGPTRLRTETAGLVAATLLAAGK